jgi:hypothetical protein
MLLDRIVPAQGSCRVQFADGLDCPQGDFMRYVCLDGSLTSPCCSRQLATAMPMAGPLSSWTKWMPVPMHDGLHEGDSPDPAGMAAGPVEAQRSAPVMAHEGHAIDLEFLEHRYDDVGLPCSKTTGLPSP